MAAHNAEPEYFAAGHGSPSAGERQRRPAQTMAMVKPAYLRRSLVLVMASSRVHFRFPDNARSATCGTSRIDSRAVSIAAPRLSWIEPNSSFRKRRAIRELEAPH